MRGASSESESDQGACARDRVDPPSGAAGARVRRR